MIVRSWRGTADSGTADDYLRHLETAVFPELRRIEGFRCAYVMRREVAGGFEFVVETAWDSMEAIRTFAGEDVEKAVVPRAARVLLREFDATVQHYEVVAEERRSDA